MLDKVIDWIIDLFPKKKTKPVYEKEYIVIEEFPEELYTGKKKKRKKRKIKITYF